MIQQLKGEEDFYLLKTECINLFTGEAWYW